MLFKIWIYLEFEFEFILNLNFQKQAGGMRKEPQLFPPDTIEGISPVLGKRKKLNQKDLNGKSLGGGL